MMLRLRPAQVTDLPSIYRGEQDYIRCWEPQHEAEWRLQFERHLERWVENFDRLTVAVINDRFAGYSLWASEQDCAELYTINVSPSGRRHGIGRALLEAYRVAAAQSGFTRLTLSVHSENPARFLYQQAGFSCIGVDDHQYLGYELISG